MFINNKYQVLLMHLQKLIKNPSDELLGMFILILPALSGFIHICK